MTIEVADDSELDKIPVRRRNTQGVQTIPVSITLPIELNQTINTIAIKAKKSKSLVITELIEKGLSHE